MEQPKFEEPPAPPEEEKSGVEKEENAGPVSIPKELGKFFTEAGEHFFGKTPEKKDDGSNAEKK